MKKVKRMDMAMYFLCKYDYGTLKPVVTIRKGLGVERRIMEGMN
jgi:hypothetical protein